MSKFINDHIAMFVILALLAAAVALYMAARNRKAIKTCPGGCTFSPADKSKLDRISIDDQGNLKGIPATT